MKRSFSNTVMIAAFAFTLSSCGGNVNNSQTASPTAKEMALPAEETIEFTVPETGTYDFICTFPGHSATMRGKLFVE